MLLALSIKLGKFNHSPVLIYGGNIPDLKLVQVTDNGVEFGAAVTVTELGRALVGIKEQISGRIF